MDDIYFISVVEYNTNHVMLIRADMIFKIEAGTEHDYTIIHFTNGEVEYVKDSIADITKAFAEG